MDLQIANEQALKLLRESSTENGFLASPLAKDNYQRVWTRDGVITGLAALSSRENDLLVSFEKTLQTLGKHISPLGHVPSNVDINTGQVSYGGLAGRADTGSWWIIGICLFAKFTGDKKLLYRYMEEIHKIHELYQAWEYNNKDLVYVPLAGDWADEFVLHGYVLYDQVLRYAALKLSGILMEKSEWLDKSEAIKKAVYENYFLHQDWLSAGIHILAKKRILEKVKGFDFLPAAFNPSGYQAYFDALGNALAIIFNIHPDPKRCLDKAYEDLGLLVPAFYPVIKEGETDFNLLRENYRYEFRNKPHEFHNGGVWPMVNGFWGMAKYLIKGKSMAEECLDGIKALNSQHNWEFNECFHGLSFHPCGVPKCTWSAAGQVILENTLSKGFYILD
jgi:GH15 family glucan-1,4-alpha-glucosidase